MEAFPCGDLQCLDESGTRLDSFSNIPMAAWGIIIEYGNTEALSDEDSKTKSSVHAEVVEHVKG